MYWFSVFFVVGVPVIWGCFGVFVIGVSVCPTLSGCPVSCSLPRCCNAVPRQGCRTDGGNIPRSSHTTVIIRVGSDVSPASTFLSKHLKISTWYFLAPRPHTCFYVQGAHRRPQVGVERIFSGGWFLLPLNLPVQHRGRGKQDAAPNINRLCEFCNVVWALKLSGHCIMYSVHHDLWQAESCCKRCS